MPFSEDFQELRASPFADLEVSCTKFFGLQLLASEALVLGMGLQPPG
jgi:hypothetical protein